jgi:hypothetical protein
MARKVTQTPFVAQYAPIKAQTLRRDISVRKIMIDTNDRLSLIGTPIIFALDERVLITAKSEPHATTGPLMFRPMITHGAYWEIGS